jgi:N6-adenosine-specific RNA methylase IME4
MTNSPETCDPRQLKPHPQNLTIYGDEDVAELAASIAASGYIEPLLVTTNFIVVSGHRRLKAVLSLGLDEVPIRMKTYPSENEVLEELLLANQYREKTPEQKGREARVWTGVLAEKAKQRMAQGGRGGLGKGVEAASIAGTTRDEVAAIVGAGSGRNLSNIDRTIDAIDLAPPLVADAYRVVLKKSAETAAQLTKAEPETVLAVGEKLRVNPDMAASQALKEVITEQKKTARVQEIETIRAATTTKTQALTLLSEYDVIVLDPPWQYGTEYDPNGRRVANPYPEMSLDEIAALNIPAAQDCILWLWTTHKFMKHSFGLLEAWGFEDKMILTWVKNRMGIGSWLRSQSEFCIMAVKGKPLITLTNQTTVLQADVREHSRKPDEFYALVDSLCVGTKLDYFARQTRDGWHVFGNEFDKFGGVE